MDLSIIIATKNRPDHVKARLRQIWTTLPAIKAEVIIADSSTPPLWAEDVSENATADLKVIACGNRSSVEALNLAIRLAQGSLILVWSDDVIMGTHTLAVIHETMTRLVARDPLTVGIVFFKQPNEPCRCFFIVTEIFVTTPAVFQRVGLLDEGYHHSHVDSDFGARCMNANISMVALEGTCSIHEPGPGAMATGANYEQDSQRFHQKFPEKKIILQGPLGNMDLRKALVCPLCHPQGWSPAPIEQRELVTV